MKLYDSNIVLGFYSANGSYYDQKAHLFVNSRRELLTAHYELVTRGWKMFYTSHNDLIYSKDKSIIMVLNTYDDSKEEKLKC